MEHIGITWPGTLQEPPTRDIKTSQLSVLEFQAVTSSSNFSVMTFHLFSETPTNSPQTIAPTTGPSPSPTIVPSIAPTEDCPRFHFGLFDSNIPFGGWYVRASENPIVYIHETDNHIMALGNYLAEHSAPVVSQHT